MDVKTPSRTKIQPVGEMVLIFHDEDQNITKKGIILPDSAKVEVLTGRIAAIPERMKEDQLEYPYQEFDRVIYDIRYRIPVELFSENRYYLVDRRYIYGVVSGE